MSSQNNKTHSANGSSSRIPVSQPHLSGNEEAYVLDAIRSTWISSTGHYVDRFEEEFSERCGAVGALSVCNGTAALHLALLALGAGPGDEVIVPAMTYVATANAVRYTGAVPVFVDVDPNSWCLDPAQLEAAVTEHTVGVIPVHLFGNPADMDAIQTVASSHGLWVLEDAAEAHFATYRGKPVGSLGDLGVFSFYGNKIITSGEGGAVVDRDGRFVDRLRLFRGQGVESGQRFYHSVIGYNYRLTNVACALLCAQLENSGEMLEQRRAVEAHYRELLPNSVCTFQKTVIGASVPWIVGVLFASLSERRNAEDALGRINVETRPFFVPLHKLPMYSAEGLVMPVAERLADTGLFLPTYPGLSRSDIQRVVDGIEGSLRG